MVRGANESSFMVGGGGVRTRREEEALGCSNDEVMHALGFVRVVARQQLLRSKPDVRACDIHFRVCVCVSGCIGRPIHPQSIARPSTGRP